MSNWYKTRKQECTVLRHLEGQILVVNMGGIEHRETVSKEVADVVEMMLETAYLVGKIHVRNEIKSRLGLGE